MKYRHIALVLCAMSLVGGANAAGLKVKAKQLVSQDVVESEVARVQQKCGNAELKASIDWQAWSGYDYQEARVDPVNVAGWVGGQVNNIYDDMVALCTTIDHAELYKAEFSKLKKLNFSGQSKITERDTSFSLSPDGTELNIKLNGNGTYNSKFAKLLQDAWG
ncbi:hypothetical protein [Photobacterium atrarenae]|uniref:Uncharacterized protein n=1 Tax=Photobacterium atrarenae TaxID=865757 RepID=A0ABY5GES0_9GAMM|nr:hypothetical protein [Photobacterium atrarenae]UTV27599.1 hypothetical protein NNL38_15065 [Photobacterium atrarenae]